jgi:rhodanese-related sulfurtransferase
MSRSNAVRGSGGPTALALAALVLATGALVTDTAGRPATWATSTPSGIAPIELAKRIRDARPGPRLIDVRTPSEFEDYHIVTAANVPLEEMAARTFDGTGLVVVYDEAGEPDGEAERAARILKQAGLTDVNVLAGGLVAWTHDVLRPTIADDATPAERAKFEETAELSRWFDGMPRIVPAAEAERAKAARTGASAAAESRLIRRRGC